MCAAWHAAAHNLHGSLYSSIVEEVVLAAGLYVMGCISMAH